MNFSERYMINRVNEVIGNKDLSINPKFKIFVFSHGKKNNFNFTVYSDFYSVNESFDKEFVLSSQGLDLSKITIKDVILNIINEFLNIYINNKIVEFEKTKLEEIIKPVENKILNKNKGNRI